MLLQFFLSKVRYWSFSWSYLRTYDTIKAWRWNFFKFSWVVHYRKICKIMSKNRESPCYFLSSAGQKIYKNWTKDTIFVYILDFIFMVFFAQKLIYTISIWFNVVFGSFFQQDHLLNLITSGIYVKRWTTCARILKQKLM